MRSTFDANLEKPAGGRLLRAGRGLQLLGGVRRDERFDDSLEVAFEDGVRRLNSNHPRVGQKPPEPAAGETPDLEEQAEAGIHICDFIIIDTPYGIGQGIGHG